MVLLIDNYDSFSYNLYQLVGSINPDIRVIRNDELTIAQIEALHPDQIILSPGPGRPADAGVCVEAARYFAGKVPVLGVCLGHQAICEAFGATVSYAKELMHGKQSQVTLDTSCPIFRGLPDTIPAARYHSLAALEETIPDTLTITGRTADGEIMAVKHRDYEVYGLQFHPESILTPDGMRILQNFLGSAPEANQPVRRNPPMIAQAIQKLAARQDLTYEEAHACMDEIMSGTSTPIQNTAFLVSLAMKGETNDEIAACAAGMRSHALPVQPHQDTLEIVGTGGDRSDSFNISSTAALVIAAAGVAVAKHGNRAASSKSGAADCLEALGVNLDQPPEKAVELLDQVGICFFFAQKYHTSMKYVGGIRKELGIRTVFNLLGPLTNPASPAYQLMGVYDESLLEPMSSILPTLGVKRGMVVYNRDRMDEFSTSNETAVCEFGPEGKKTYTVTPEQFGFTRCQKSDLTGGTPQENAQITRDVLSGKPGPQRDTVLLNAGAALYIAGKASTLEEGVRLAAQAVDSGKALATLENYITLSNS